MEDVKGHVVEFGLHPKENWTTDSIGHKGYIPEGDMLGVHSERSFCYRRESGWDFNCGGCGQTHYKGF